MTYEQVQLLEEKTRQMHHDFGNVLLSISMVREKFETWSPETKARHEAAWQAAYIKALESLSTCLNSFDTWTSRGF
jgi:hypothetical protein